METQPTPSVFERFNQWITESIMVKLFSIGFLILTLLIPASWIEDLIRERQYRADEVIREVSDKWSGPQMLSGPVLRIPFTKKEKIKTWHEGKQVEEIIERDHDAYFLPEDYQVKTDISTEVRKRGIFEVVLYKSDIDMQAQFAVPDFSTWSIPDEQVHWHEAVLLNGISDLRGIGENPVVKAGHVLLVSEPLSDIGIQVNQYVNRSASRAVATTADVPAVSGIISPLRWQTRPGGTLHVSLQLNLKGSESLYFVPTGKSTEVTSTSAWPSPSFEGKLLPEHNITDSGFSAVWKVLSFNRPFSQKWVDREQSLSGSEFGVRLLIPADQYQKSTRTAKYGQLIILLAFTALFLVEITTKTRIHPFQYILIGAALIIYYTLLLSFSEQVGYNAAYAIASVATTVLVTLYSSSFLRSRSIVLLFSLLMASFYTFIFIIIQAQDFSLLIGSIGLFLIIGLLMYFSKNIKWYGAKA
ncbi:MAG: cell envelope integrity protein CreD [Cyclobacteriaceae bacterium]|nr:cell envelope integrity protein CreD [Cyclobacteriaceae bacterium]